MYGVGIIAFYRAAAGFLPWLLLICVNYAAQFGTAQLSVRTSGFLMAAWRSCCTLALGLRMTPKKSSRVLLAPGFWLMVPSSIGLVGITTDRRRRRRQHQRDRLMLVSMLHRSRSDSQATAAPSERCCRRIRLRDSGAY